MSDFYAILKVQNGRIRKAMEAAGIKNPLALARAAGKQPSAVYDLLNFKMNPRCKDGTWRTVTIAISDALFEIPENLFPDHLTELMPTNVIAGYVERGQLPGAEHRNLLGPVESAEIQEAKDRIPKVLDTLTFREGQILRCRYGLNEGGHEFTLAECAKIFRISLERVRMIEARAIRKMQHPARSSRLEAL